MTSIAAAQPLLRRLAYADGAMPASPRFSFDVDFDTALPFADLPFDPASPSARYPADARTELRDMLDDVAATVRIGAPAAFTFVDEQVQRVLVRRFDAGRDPVSSSNRSHVGQCVLTNLHLADDRVVVAAEALVHEAVHQYLYRIEGEDGSFCDLDAHGRYRSPWSGNWIPLHSFIHACFVYFALLGFWSRCAATITERDRAARVRDRIARCLFGYRFVVETIDRPAFPRAAVQPAVLEAIRRIAQATRAADVPARAHRNLRDALAACHDADWLRHLATILERVGSDAPVGAEVTA